jgi:hypothetical protein
MHHAGVSLKTFDRRPLRFYIIAVFKKLQMQTHLIGWRTGKTIIFGLRKDILYGSSHYINNLVGCKGNKKISISL